MVSLWPWRRTEDASPASFEKTLSALSEKIAKAQLQLESLNQHSRRTVALWTLYTSFAYLLCTIILALVVGWRNWGTLEYTVVAGSPLIMYLVRGGIMTYYAYRIDNVTHRLEEHQLERTKTIDRLKEATKYNSTQQLLEKYGGAAPSPTRKPKVKAQLLTPKRSHQQLRRTGMGPPATANIQRPGSAPQPTRPRHIPEEAPPVPPILNIQHLQQQQRFPIRTPHQTPHQTPHAEFAPNAFSSAPRYNYNEDVRSDGQWYDRILDVLLGEDETSPKNRIVLICRHCRLVNGQAPPGIKRVEELGQWKCFGCGGTNGEVDEGKRIVEEVIDKAKGEEKLGDGSGRESSPEEGKGESKSRNTDIKEESGDETDKDGDKEAGVSGDE